jgi:prepilin-type processing-associated H-X9-DG protein
LVNGTALCIQAFTEKGDGVMLDSSRIAGGSVYASARTNLDVISAADGTTNTLLFSEKNGSLVTQTSWTVISPEILNASSIPANWSTVPVFGLKGTASLKVINTGTDYAPSSNHPGGVVTTFADGHTLFLRDSIAPHVYAQLVTSDSKPAVGGGYSTNSPLVSGSSWLQYSGAPYPYTLSEGDF